MKKYRTLLLGLAVCVGALSASSVAIATTMPTSDDANQLFATARLVHTKTINKNGYGLMFSHFMSPNWGTGINYINEGIVLGVHHRDGLSFQFLARSPKLFNQKLELDAGIGPYLYADTIPLPSSITSNTYADAHGIGLDYSISSTLYTLDPWLFYLSFHHIQTRHSFNSNSLFVGFGLNLDKLNQGPSISSCGKNELSLLLGSTVYNAKISKISFAQALQYKYLAAPNYNFALTYINEGRTSLLKRQGVAATAWLTHSFIDNRFNLGLGAGPYLTEHDSNHTLDVLAMLEANYALNPNWSLNLDWARVITTYDRDTDLALAGLSYRF